MRSKFWYILSLFSTLLAYGQVTLIAETENKDLKVNHPFKVNFILEINGTEYVQESKLRLPDFSKYNIVGNASNQNTYINPKTNTVVNQIFFQYVLEPKVAGANKIGSALVQVNGKIYKTEPMDIFVGDVPKTTAHTRDIADLYLNMEVKDKEVYPNQPTVAILRAYSKNYSNFRQVGNPILPQQKNVNFATVTEHRAEILAASDHDEYASQIIGVFLIFPNHTGSVEIAPIATHLKNKEAKLLSNKINLTVKKLPANSPSGFSNAVGKFSFSLESDTLKGEVNKPLHVQLKFVGEGNLTTMQLPKLVENSQYKIYTPKITHQVTAERTGLQGQVTADYVIVPTAKGKIELQTEEFAYFDPEAQKYINLGARMLNLEVFTPEQLEAAKTPLDKVNEVTDNLLSTVNNAPIISTITKANKKNQEKQEGNKFLLLGLLTLAGVGTLLYFLNIKRKKENLAIAQSSVKPIETIREAEAKLKQKEIFSLEDRLHYLGVLKDQGKKDDFILHYKSLVKDIDTQLRFSQKKNLPTFLSEHFGSATLAAFQEIEEKIDVEKYSPISSPENLSELYQAMLSLYNNIMK